MTSHQSADTPQNNAAARAPYASRTLAWRLWRDYLSRYWPRLALALGAMAIYAVSASAIPIGVEWINAGLSGGGDRFTPTIRQVTIWGPLLFIALAVVHGAAQYAHTRLSAGAALGALRDIQNAMFDRLMALDIAQQREEVSGQMTSRFTNDAIVLRETLYGVAKAVRDLFTLIGLCAIMIWYDWVLFLVVLAIYPLIGIPIARIGDFLRRTSSATQAQAGDINALIGETVTGARMVKTYQIEPLERARAGYAFDNRMRLLRTMANVRALNEPLIFVCGAVAFALVIVVVSMRIESGALSAPAFFSFIVALLLLSQPARGLGVITAVAQEGFGAFERMLAVIDSAPDIRNASDATLMPPGPGNVVFEEVSFSYTESEAVLSDVSLEIPAGQMVALVGESGAGKSTLMNLLPRLYEPTTGRILIDGADIAKATIHSLRERMALVSQDAVIFNMSAMENIAFGRPGAARADVIRAATDAFANDFISALPNGYDTPLGESGNQLSGGQRQRIALA
ncbi:MAG: ABC transporter transmembrane domain-containing protein, partial [Pseudomonadota bacterium]